MPVQVHTSKATSRFVGGGSAAKTAQVCHSSLKMRIRAAYATSMLVSLSRDVITVETPRVIITEDAAQRSQHSAESPCKLSSELPAMMCGAAHMSSKIARRLHLRRQGISEAKKVSDVVSPECNTSTANVGFQVVKFPVGKCRSVFR